MEIWTNGNNFVITFKGNPFQVTPNYPKREQYGSKYTYEGIKAYIAKHPEDVIGEYVPFKPKSIPEQIEE